ACAFDRNWIHKEIVLSSFCKNVCDGGSGLAIDAHVDGFIVGERGVTLSDGGVVGFGIRAEKNKSNILWVAEAPARGDAVGSCEQNQCDQDDAHWMGFFFFVSWTHSGRPSGLFQSDFYYKKK